MSDEKIEIDCKFELTRKQLTSLALAGIDSAVMQQIAAVEKQHVFLDEEQEEEVDEVVASEEMMQENETEITLTFKEIEALFCFAAENCKPGLSTNSFYLKTQFNKDSGMLELVIYAKNGGNSKNITDKEFWAKG